MSDATEKIEGTILCADDTEAQRYAVSRVLRRAGFRVIEARTGREALELSCSGPDLIVLDVNLPDINGIEVCRQIKSNESTSRTPVLQVSATLVSTEARVAGLEGGADAYLVQPIDPDELTATIRALLRIRRADEALWQSQMQYRSFFEANPLPCFVFDSHDLAILAVNTAAVQSTAIQETNSHRCPWGTSLSPETATPSLRFLSIVRSLLPSRAIAGIERKMGSRLTSR